MCIISTRKSRTRVLRVWPFATLREIENRACRLIERDRQDPDQPAIVQPSETGYAWIRIAKRERCGVRVYLYMYFMQM